MITKSRKACFSKLRGENSNYCALVDPSISFGNGLAQARIMRTNVLIDQIVYKLYGLTEEKIGIVEA